MKRNKITLIGGIHFEYCGETTQKAVRVRSLYDCYEKPSETKRQIWYEWISWFQKMKCFEYGVSSYNCRFFSIEAIVYENGNEYLLVITRAHKKAYKIA